MSGNIFSCVNSQNAELWFELASRLYVWPNWENTDFQQTCKMDKSERKRCCRNQNPIALKERVWVNFRCVRYEKLFVGWLVVPRVTILNPNGWLLMSCVRIMREATFASRARNRRWFCGLDSHNIMDVEHNCDLQCHFNRSTASEKRPVRTFRPKLTWILWQTFFSVCSFWIGTHSQIVQGSRH